MSLKKLFLVHGDFDTQIVFKKFLNENGFPRVEIPELGEVVALTAAFDNTSATDTGFGPYVDVYLPATGADGAGAASDDGLTFVNGSATFNLESSTG